MIDYRNELLKTFKDDAYWLVNKHLASHLGLVPTILLSELISKENYHYQRNELIEDKYFYHKSEVIEDNLFITSDKRRSCVDILKNSGTISIITKGMPAKHYYSVNHEMIIKIMAMDTGTKENREKLKPVKIKPETPPQEVGNPSDREIQSLVVPFSDLRDMEIQPKSSEKQSTSDSENGITINNNKDNIKDNIKGVNNKEEGITGNLEHTHTNPSGIPKVEEIFLDSLKIDFIDNSEIERKYELQIRDINTKYDNILGQVPKLTTTELIGNSEKLMQTLGIGFDDNPRRILNKIYNSLPNDHRIMEDAKDVEVVRDFIAKYKSANPETRSALSKRLYQALELMIKIYYIKKFGEEFRGKLYPEILDKNLVLYLNCNPTLKYCFGGFSNDIDGVYEEIKRAIDKRNKKMVDEIQEEKQKELARLEAYRKAEEYNSIPESERIAWQNRLHNIMTGKNRSTETLEVVRCRTHEEEMELNRLREMTAEMFRSNIKPEPWIRERVAELSTMRGYYGD
jgi:hypothetical protein